MQRGDLHRRSIGVDAAHLRICVVTLLEPGAQTVERSPHRRRCGAHTRKLASEQLGDVIEVGEFALATLGCEHGGHHLAGTAHVVVPREERLGGELFGPPRTALLQSRKAWLGVGVERVEVGSVLVEEHAETGRPHGGCMCRTLQGREQQTPFVRRRAAQHTARSRTHRWNTSAAQRLDDLGRLRMRLHQDRDITGLHRDGAEAGVDRVELEQFDDLENEVGDDRATRQRRGHALAAVEQGVVGEPADLERRAG